MEQLEFLDLTGTDRVIKNTVEIIKNHTSDNDIHFSSDEKNNLEQSYEHSTSEHAPTDAEKNVIVGVQQNGKDLTVDLITRKVNINTPTKLSELENDAGFVTNVTGGGIIYELSKDGNQIILSGSDGSTTSVVDENTIIEVDSEFSDISTNPVENKIIKQELDKKVDKVDGMGLSSNDYTDIDKEKLATISEGAEVNVRSDWNETDTTSDAFIKNKPASLPANGGNADTVNGHTIDVDVPSDAKFTDTVYDDSEVNNRIDSVIETVNTKADENHNHDEEYDSLGSASSALASAKEYIDTKTANLASTTVVDNKVSSHNTSSVAHNDIRELISGLTTRLNTLADSDDTTLDQMSEIVAYIKSNKSLIDSITTSKINVSDIVNNLTTASTSKVLSANQGVVIKGLIDTLQSEIDEKADAEHTHAIADVNGLQTALDEKANSSHGTHVSYSTTAPVMDGTASVGSATTVARSDHKHPTDTSRASASDLTSHTGNTTVHITSTERTNWNAAKTHADTAHAPSNAEKNQNAFSNVTVGSTTIAADTTTDTLTLVAGSNITITPDATNDKITIAATDTNTDTKVKQTRSTASNYRALLMHYANATEGTDPGAATEQVYYNEAISACPSTGVLKATTFKGALNGNADTATTSTNVSASAASDDVDRHIWFSHSTTETKRSYDDEFKYNPSTNTLTVSNVTGKAGSATKLATARTIDGVSFNGSANITHYGTCSTAAGTAAKTVALTGFTLATGASVKVKFTVTNTADNPTLNVNSTGAKAIMYRGSAISKGYLAANRVYEFVYDGTDWELVGDINTDSNTTYSAMTGATSSAAGKTGLVPAPAAGKQASFLRGDGTWVVPTNTTYSNMTAATSSAAGKAGLVPAPAAGAQAKFLRGDGTWQTPTNTTYSVVTASANGLVPMFDAADGTIDSSSNDWVLTNNNGSIGWYKLPANAFNNTTYSAATTSANGLMSSTDKTKLDATNIAYGTCSTAAATAAKVITISGNTNWKLAAGSMITVKFSVTNTAQNPTFNVNSTGAKSVWYNTALITTSNLGYAGTANRPMNFVYDGTQYVFVGWSYDANSTYSNAGLGQGYGTCSTAAATKAKVVTLSSYSLTTGGIVAVKFTNAVPASATMNINSKGAKSIYYRGAAIKAGVIEAGDIATFIYNGSQYHLLTIDKQNIKGEIISTTEPSGQGSGDYWLLDY